MGNTKTGALQMIIDNNQHVAVLRGAVVTWRGNRFEIALRGGLPCRMFKSSGKALVWINDHIRYQDEIDNTAARYAENNSKNESAALANDGVK